jgi:hypothetical protein
VSMCSFAYLFTYLCTFPFTYSFTYLLACYWLWFDRCEGLDVRGPRIAEMLMCFVFGCSEVCLSGCYFHCCVWYGIHIGHAKIQSWLACS